MTERIEEGGRELPKSGNEINPDIVSWQFGSTEMTAFLTKQTANFSKWTTTITYVISLRDCHPWIVDEASSTDTARLWNDAPTDSFHYTFPWFEVFAGINKTLLGDHLAHLERLIPTEQFGNLIESFESLTRRLQTHDRLIFVDDICIGKLAATLKQIQQGRGNASAGLPSLPQAVTP